jgi:hypothetical protein
VLSNLLALVLYVAFFSLNAIDTITTRKALNKGGFEEKMMFTRRMIEELGLSRAMLIKALLGVPFVMLVILCWNDAIFGCAVSLFFIIPTVVLSYVVCHNCIELWKSRQNRK